jgi:hypothetical protein
MLAGSMYFGWLYCRRNDPLYGTGLAANSTSIQRFWYGYQSMRDNNFSSRVHQLRKVMLSALEADKADNLLGPAKQAYAHQQLVYLDYATDNLEEAEAEACLSLKLRDEHHLNLDNYSMSMFSTWLASADRRGNRSQTAKKMADFLKRNRLQDKFISDYELAWVQVANAHLHMGDAKTALAILTHLKDIRTSSFYPEQRWEAMSACYLRLGDYKNAFIYAHLASTKNCSDNVLKTLLPLWTVICIEQGEWDKAEELCKQYQRQFQVHQCEGMLELLFAAHRGNWQNADNQYQYIKPLLEKNPLPYFQQNFDAGFDVYAKLLRNAGKQKEAEAILKEGKELEQRVLAIDKTSNDGNQQY